MFGNLEDIMQAFGGGMPGMMGGMPDTRRRKGRDVGLALPVTLEDLYNGKEVDLPHERTVLCDKCKGSGSKKEGARGTCNTCRGSGARIIRRQMGPMIQQMQVQCDACNGEGYKIDPKDICPTCQGRRTKTISKPLKVVISPGMEHQQQIPFRGEGDEYPGVDPGDIVVVLQQQKHEQFQRVGNDLLIKTAISVEQALCGFDIVITHLDGRKLLVSHKGSVIKPDDIKIVAGEGMPAFNTGSIKSPTRGKGDLIIVFSVVFPERLQTSQIEVLRTVLPPPPVAAAAQSSDEDQTHYVQRESLEAVRRMMEQEDDDDEDRGGGGGVQCAQQ